MKILIISDTHHITDEFFNLINDYTNNVDYIIHCGDSELDNKDTIWTIVDCVVKGNMDFGYQYDEQKILKTLHGNIFVTHGHLYGVNRSREALSEEALQHNCHIACYGHTHILNVEYINNVLCVNPGSFNHSRGPISERTYAIMTIHEDATTIEFYRYDKILLPHLTQKIMK